MIDENLLKFGLPAAVVLGIYLLVSGGLSAVGDILPRAGAWFHLRRTRHRLTVRLNALHPPATSPAAAFTERALYGLGAVNWVWLQLAGSLVGLALVSLVVPPTVAPAGAVVGYFVPGLVRQYLHRRARARLRRQVRALVDALSLQPLDQGLAPALARLAGRDTPGVLQARLKHHVQAMRLGQDPLHVLHALAADLRSAELTDLARRLDAARRGGGSLEEALYEEAKEIAAEMLAQARIAAEGMPNRMMFPILITLFPPILMLALYPVAMYLVDTLTGIGRGAPVF